MNTKLAELVMSRISKHGDFYHALFSAALDETKDVKKAIKLADQAIEDSSESASRFQFKEGGIDLSSSDKSISREEVGIILSNQYYNKSANVSPARSIRKWVTSNEFTLVKNVPLWCLRPFKYVYPDDHTHSKGPLIVDADKADYQLRHGAFGSNPEYMIIDGKHRYFDMLRRGIKNVDCFVGDAIKSDLERHIKEFGPKRSKFIMRMNRYYDDPSFENHEQLVEAALDCDLTEEQIDMLISNFKKGIKFNAVYGEFEDAGWKP